MNRIFFDFHEIDTDQSGSGLGSSAPRLDHSKVQPAQQTHTNRLADPAIPRTKTSDRKTIMPTSSGCVFAEGKSLKQDGHTYRVKGVTYGTFKPDADGHQYCC